MIWWSAAAAVVGVTTKQADKLILGPIEPSLDTEACLKITAGSQFDLLICYRRVRMGRTASVFSVRKFLKQLPVYQTTETL